jgi:AbiV family abortive infection protein
MSKNYTGALSEAQIEQGIRACLAHAKALKRVLLDVAPNERGLAFSLACIRVEELAKGLLLIQMRTGDHDDAAWGRFWKRFRDHKQKWQEYGESQFKHIFKKSGVADDEQAKELGKGFSAWAGAKNSGLYVDFTPSIGFRSPSIFPESLLQMTLRMGDVLARDIRAQIK